MFAFPCSDQVISPLPDGLGRISSLEGIPNRGPDAPLQGTVVEVRPSRSREQESAALRFRAQSQTISRPPHPVQAVETVSNVVKVAPMPMEVGPRPTVPLAAPSSQRLRLAAHFSDQPTERFKMGVGGEDFSRGGNKASLASLGRDLAGQMSELGNPSLLVPPAKRERDLGGVDSGSGSGAMGDARLVNINLSGRAAGLQRLQPVARGSVAPLGGHKSTGSDNDDVMSDISRQSDEGGGRALASVSGGSSVEPLTEGEVKKRHRHRLRRRRKERRGQRESADADVEGAGNSEIGDASESGVGTSGGGARTDGAREFDLDFEHECAAGKGGREAGAKGGEGGAHSVSSLGSRGNALLPTGTGVGGGGVGSALGGPLGTVCHERAGRDLPGLDEMSVSDGMNSRTSSGSVQPSSSGMRVLPPAPLSRPTSGRPQLESSMPVGGSVVETRQFHNAVDRREYQPSSPRTTHLLTAAASRIGDGGTGGTGGKSRPASGVALAPPRPISGQRGGNTHTNAALQPAKSTREGGMQASESNSRISSVEYSTRRLQVRHRDCTCIQECLILSLS
jgi:hypothetical protein